MRKSHSEHFSTAVPQKADVVLNSANGSFVPKAAVSNRSKQHLYSITSSAAASSLSGTVRPSAFAVLRLMASSNFVGC